MQMITAKIKDGIITLPKRLRCLWEGTDLVAKINNQKIIIEKPRVHPKVRIDKWKKVAGIWKNRKMSDPVKWQREIRKEWERPLPKI